MALLFGTELTGLTHDAIAHADTYLRIPMFGFTESFNISVSAALSMQFLTWRLHKSDIHWKLSGSEQTELLIDWCKRVIKKSDAFERNFYNTLKTKDV